MFAVETLPTRTVETVNVAEVLPAETVTDAGTVATFVFELLNAITAPPVGAGLSVVIVPVLELGPSTEDGFNVTLLMCICGGMTVTVFDCVEPPYPAVRRRLVT